MVNTMAIMRSGTGNDCREVDTQGDSPCPNGSFGNRVSPVVVVVLASAEVNMPSFSLPGLI